MGQVCSKLLAVIEHSPLADKPTHINEIKVTFLVKKG